MIHLRERRLDRVGERLDGKSSFNQHATRRSHVLATIGIFALSALVLLLASPPFHPVPDRDSGVFLYIGQRILEGEIPYRDVWDHKPPVVFYLNAVALFLSGHSLWGIWLLEVLAVGSAALFGYILLARLFGRFPAALGSLAWLSQLNFLAADGNYTELYALPLQFGTLYVLFASPTARNSCWRWILAGALGALAFLTKQPQIGLWAALIVVLFIRAFRREWRASIWRLVALGTGGAIVLGLVALYFYSHDAFSHLWDAAFRYNFAYSGEAITLVERVEPILHGLHVMAASGIVYGGVVGWFVAARRLLSRKWKESRAAWLLAVVLSELPLEFLFVSLSGRTYDHYYMPWLPPFAVLVAYFAYALLRPSENRPSRYAHHDRRAVAAALLGMVFIPTLFATRTQLATMQIPDASGITRYEATEYLRNTVGKEEHVLVWGAEANVHFAANRISPTRFVYQYPLYTAGYHDVAMVKEFLDDISRKPPAVIVDAWRDSDKVPPLDANQRAGWVAGDAAKYQALPEMQTVFDYIALHYEHVGTLGPQEWDVYRYKGEVVQ